MTFDIDAHHCDKQSLARYVDGLLPESSMELVEEHLSVCKDCRTVIESMAATPCDWRQAADLLPLDQFDQRAQQDAFGSGSELLGSRPQTAAMLSREIQGWIDPTDDPNSLGRFAGYEVVGIVGHGGMGIVLKGFEASLNRFIAIKILAPRLATNGTARKRFSREAQAAAAVLHENVIAIHRVDEWHGLPFLVMPYVGGESLQTRIDDEGPQSLETILRISMQIASGLAAAHDQGLVHRDIKPANILLDRGVDRITITDFGLARAVDDASMTRTGIIAGTPQYMSPEQAAAQAIDTRSDLFSLGSVMYAMATGRPPFRGSGGCDVLQRIRDGQTRSLHDLDPSIPSWFETLVNWLHAKSPTARPQSARDVQELLTECLLHLTQSNHPIPKELSQPLANRVGGGTRRPRWRHTFVGASILLLTLIMLTSLSPLIHHSMRGVTDLEDEPESTIQAPLQPVGDWRMELVAGFSRKAVIVETPEGAYRMTAGKTVFSGLYDLKSRQLVMVQGKDDQRMVGLTWEWDDVGWVLVSQPGRPNGSNYVGSRLVPWGLTEGSRLNTLQQHGSQR